MSSTETSINILPHSEYIERKTRGMIEDMYAGAGLVIIECADEREHTLNSDLKKYDRLRAIVGPITRISPARYFGAASGIAVAQLVTVAAIGSETEVRELLPQSSPEAFAELSADLSHRAHEQDIDLVQHSAEDNENQPDSLASEDHQAALGCALAALLGKVLRGAKDPLILNEAQRIQNLVDLKLPLIDARQGIQRLSHIVPSEFSLVRSALRNVVSDPGKHTPISILKGQHVPAGQAKVTVDFANVKADPSIHKFFKLPRYHTTPELGNLLADWAPERSHDDEIATAAGLLIALSARAALSGSETPHALGIEIIPPEYGAPLKQQKHLQTPRVAPL